MVDKNNLISLLTLTGMVSSDTGLPDPDNPNGELRPANDDIILVTDDDELSDDTEAFIVDDYQPLPAEDMGDSNHGYGSSEDEASGYQPPNNASSNNPSIPPIIPIEEELVKEVWSTPPPQSVDIEMDSKKVDEVKQVMAGITLPASSIPEWAVNIPEEEWKNQLLKRLQNLQTEKK